MRTCATGAGPTREAQHPRLLTGHHWSRRLASQSGLLCASSRTQPRFRVCAAPNPGSCLGQLLAPRIAQISCRGSNNCPRDGKHQLFSAFWELCWARGEQSQWRQRASHPARQEEELPACYALPRILFLPRKGKGFKEGLNLRLAFLKQFSS